MNLLILLNGTLLSFFSSSEIKSKNPCIHIKLGYKIGDEEMSNFFTEHKLVPSKAFIVKRGVRQVSKG